VGGTRARRPRRCGRAHGPATVLGLVALFALASCGATSAAGTPVGRAGARTPKSPVTVHLFGDSLSYEVEAVLREQLGPSYDLRVSAFGGVAPCDMRPQIEDTLEKDSVDLVLAQFSGNARTPCMRADGATSEAAWRARYRADTSAIVDRSRTTGVPLLLVGSPPMPLDRMAATTPDPDYQELAAEAAREGAPVTFLDAGAAVSALGGAWAASLPCLPFEGAEMGCAGGEIAVRSPDGVHFCPGAFGALDGTVPTCPAWSSGAWRYASAITHEVRQRAAAP